MESKVSNYNGRNLYFFVSKHVCRYLTYLHCRPVKFVHCRHTLNLLIQTNYSTRITCCVTLCIYQHFTNQIKLLNALKIYVFSFILNFYFLSNWPSNPEKILEIRFAFRVKFNTGLIQSVKLTSCETCKSTLRHITF